MKHVLLLLTACFLCSVTFAQINNADSSLVKQAVPVTNYDQLIKKARANNTGGIFLLIGGAVAGVTSIAMYANEADKEGTNLISAIFLQPEPYKPNYTGATIGGFVGLAMMGTGVYLLVKSKQNYRKANLLVKEQTTFVAPGLPKKFIAAGIRISI